MPERPPLAPPCDRFAGPADPARAKELVRSLVKILARELAAEDHLAEAVGKSDGAGH